MKTLLLFSFFAISLNLHASAVVAVLDTGFDVDHYDLQGRLYVNFLESRGAVECDDDQNGYVDDLHGWNFVEDDNQLIDKSLKKYFSQIESSLASKQSFFSYAHGTHVAGIITANSDATILPIKYVAPRVANLKKGWFSNSSSRLMKKIVSEYKKTAKVDAKKFKETLEYVTSRGARVVNASYGASVRDFARRLKVKYPALEDSQLLKVAREIIDDRNARALSVYRQFDNLLFVVAAGNEGDDLDLSPAAPASCGADNQIIVGSSSPWNTRSHFSNYGMNTVHVFAPGENISSAVPSLREDDHAKMSGTSQAAPYVSAIAAQIFSVYPRLKPSQVKSIIRKTVDQQGSLATMCISGGIVNYDRALSVAHDVNRGIPVDIAVLKERHRGK